MNTSYTSLNRPEHEEKIKNLTYIRQLYIFFALSLIVAFVWTTIVLNVTGMNNWFGKHWIVGTIVGVILLILILASLFVTALRKFPVNLGFYALYVIVLSFFFAFISSLNIYFYYMLCLLTAVAVGFSIYSMLFN